MAKCSFHALVSLRCQGAEVNLYISDFVQIIASSFISKSQMGVRDINMCIIITSNFNISVFGYNKWKNLMMLNIKVSSSFTLSYEKRKPSLLENTGYAIYEKRRTFESIPNCKSTSPGKLIEKKYFCNADRHCA